MSNFMLTKETLFHANTYLPIEEKTAFISKYAERCFDRLSITTGNDEMPPMYMENTALKSRYMMYALVVKYLGVEQEAEDALMSVEDYDKYAGSHIIMQIERFKKDKELCDICYDLLSDYFDLVKRFENQIRGLLAVQNDMVVRQQVLMQTTMQELPQVLEQLKGLQEKKEG